MGAAMQRRVSVQGKHVKVSIKQTGPTDWSASAEHLGDLLVVNGSTANRAASDWGEAANRASIEDFHRRKLA